MLWYTRYVLYVCDVFLHTAGMAGRSAGVESRRIRQCQRSESPAEIYLDTGHRAVQLVSQHTHTVDLPSL